MDEKLQNLSLLEKISYAQDIIRRTLDRYQKSALAWTGGKDSTLLLWLVRDVCLHGKKDLPAIIFINEGDVFKEILDFVERVSKNWNLEVIELKNEDVLKQVNKVGDMVRVELLNEVNRKELESLGFNEKEFPFEPESFVGNHLMKTLPLKRFIEENNIQVLFTAIRWDEQEARRDEAFFSERENPRHIRVHPILHFTERDVWNAIIQYEIPYCSLYAQGYRSLGARSTTLKVADVPAWEQDLENTPERAGRAQNKEAIMERLRALGYM